MKLKKPIVFHTTFSTYTATEIIGEGGAGKVYRSFDDSNEEWAIKKLDESKTSKERLKRFKNEYLFCSRNSHKNILRVTDHGLLDSSKGPTPFFVMPLYDCSLRNVLASKPAPPKVLQLFAQILDGVEAAHLKGVIHRDLKPENVLYNKGNDELVIADFGIARFTEEALYTSVETTPNRRLANFQYAAPEQRARGRKIDQRADIYALGLILNEMFTGDVPYGTDYKTIESVTPEHAYLDGIVAKMLKQSPGERLGSIEDIKKELIGRSREFINRQQLNKLQETVITTTDIDDPLVLDPIRLVDVDWNAGQLILKFQQPVNKDWIWALNNMGGYQSLMGKGPSAFAISGDTARISARDDHAQTLVNYFKEWLPKANSVYAQRIRDSKKRAEEEERTKIRQKIEQEQKRENVLKNIKF